MDARGKFGEHERCVRVARGDTSATLASFMSKKITMSSSVICLVIAREIFLI